MDVYAMKSNFKDCVNVTLVTVDWDDCIQFRILKGSNVVEVISEGVYEGELTIPLQVLRVLVDGAERVKAGIRHRDGLFASTHPVANG